MFEEERVDLALNSLTVERFIQTNKQVTEIVQYANKPVRGKA